MSGKEGRAAPEHPVTAAFRRAPKLSDQESAICRGLMVENDPNDPIGRTFAEVREHINVLRALHPGHGDLALALAVMQKANTYPPDTREGLLLGLVATVMHFAAKHNP